MILEKSRNSATNMPPAHAHTPAPAPNRPGRPLSARLRVDLNRASYEAGRAYGERLRAEWREILESDLERGATWPELEQKLHELAKLTS